MGYHVASVMDPTARASLGRTGLQVTRLALGTAPIGGLSGDDAGATASAILRRAHQLGLRFVDTAPLYGSGAAERRVGEAMAGLPRDEWTVATKVGRLIRPNPERDGAPGPVFDFSYDGVMRSVEESLARLRMNRVDVLHIHDPDRHYDAAISGAYRALDALRSQGAIKAVGAGMNQAAMEARFAREGTFDCFLLAGRYSLLDHRMALDELLPVCLEKGTSIIIGGVYNSGILANPVPGATFNYRAAEPEWLARAERLKAVCDRHDTPLMAAALQFPLAHPAVATVLTGVRSVAELDENERMFRFPVPDALWRDLRRDGLVDERAPLPGGA
jgi:D-threo-aldose 1-dehydrogenase